MRAETGRLGTASQELHTICAQMDLRRAEIEEICARLRSMDSLRAYDAPLRRRIGELAETLRSVEASARTLSRVSGRYETAEQRAVETVEGARIRYPAGKAAFLEVTFDRSLLGAES